ncbi:MAG: DUF4424 domain-containing protein [Clostridia bacterium]|nr:DUF4424 domain-containing protein [Clostridia bacterium]
MKKARVKNLKAAIIGACAAVVSVCALLLPNASVGAHANSGPAMEYGVTGAGVQVRHENSALAVESEKLTFDINQFPEQTCLPVEEGNEYSAYVTAEYKFKNTSGYALRTSMAFPLGTTPDYYYDQPNVLDATITVDGQVVQSQTRHTYGGYHLYSNFNEGALEISDDWYETDFYKPDMPVTMYTVKVDRGSYSDIAARATITCNKNKARYSCGNGYGNKMNFYFYETSQSYDSLVENGQYVFYIFGDKSAVNIEWRVEEEYYRYGLFGTSSFEYREVDLPVEVTEVTDKDGRPVYATLKDFVLSRRQPNSVVSEKDFYNGIMRHFFIDNDEDAGAYAGDFRNYSCSDSWFCTWYTYEVEVAPYASFVNTVTAPLYPTIEYTYSPYVYTYDYYLSPAKGWAGFGSLEVNINTPYYAYTMPDKFVKTETGYTAHYDKLPDGELTFKLCTVENPDYSPKRVGVSLMPLVYIISGIIVMVQLVIIVAVVFSAVYLVKSNVK